MFYFVLYYCILFQTMNDILKFALICIAVNFNLLNVLAVNYFVPFYGETPLDQYIEKFVCQQKASKWSFVYVYQFDANVNQLVSLSNSTSFHFSKNYLNCFTSVYSQINASQLLYNLKTQFDYKTIQVIFNLPFLNSHIFVKYLNILNSIYTDCSRCLPFLLLLPPNATLKVVQLGLISAHLNSTFPLPLVITFLPYQGATLHLNPVLDGCDQEERGLLFHPKNSHDFSRLKTRQCNLKGRQLTVSVNEDISHCHLFFYANSTLKGIFGPEVDLLKSLEKRYNFSSRWLYAEQIFTPHYSNGTWRGMVGYVYSGTAHFGFCGLSDTVERRKLVDFTVFTQVDSLAFLTRYPPLRSRLWLVVEPFSGSVWLLIGAFFALTLSTAVVLEKVSSYTLISRKNDTNSNYTQLWSITAEALCRILLKSCKLKKLHFKKYF